MTDSGSIAWRPTPWIAAVLGIVGGGLGLLYVQRPLYAVAYFIASIGGGLLLVGAIVLLGAGVPLEAASWIGWLVGIVCAFHAYRIARATPSVADRRWYSRWYGLAAFPVALFVITFLVRSFTYEPFAIPSESMYPTLPAGSHVFVSKAGFGNYGTFGITLWRGTPTAKIARGDIVAYRIGDAARTIYLHRVVALPGDRIRYVDHRLVINGSPAPLTVTERDVNFLYAVERLDDTDVTIAWMPDRPSTDFDRVVPPDHYVCFGDNRDNARDSRFTGFIPRDHIVGRVVKIIRSRQI